jgi:hypothetical protein
MHEEVRRAVELRQLPRLGTIRKPCDRARCGLRGAELLLVVAVADDEQVVCVRAALRQH